jgi:hypothetical protein
MAGLQWLPAISIHDSICLDDTAIPVCAGLQGALLRLVVHINHAKTLGISLSPFEIIHERPGKIPAQRHPGRDGQGGLLEVCFQVGNPLLVINLAVGA